MEKALNYIDIFAGCGGLSTGLFNAGWHGLFAVEKNADAFSTLKFNLIDTVPHFVWPEWLSTEAHDINELISKNEDMRNHHALVALEVFRKLQPDLMRCIKIQRIVRGEGLDDVIIATAICFAELFLYRFEFILSCLGHTVDTGDETLHRFLTVGNIVQDTAQTA